MKNEISYSVMAGNELAITPTALNEVFGVPIKTINNGTSLFTTKKTIHWGYVVNDKGKMILLSTIPKPTLERYNISPEASSVIKKIKLAAEISSDDSTTKELHALNLELEEVCTSEWPLLVNAYKHLKLRLRGEYAKAECALRFVVRKFNEGLSWKQLHSLIKLNCKSNAPKQSKLKLLINPGKTASYFEKKIKAGIEEGFSKILVHGNHGTPSKKKIPEEARELVIAKITNDRGLTLTKIFEELQKETNFEISYRTVRRIHKEFQELAAASNKGVDDYKINRAPYFRSSKKPGHIGDYAESDGTRYAFVSKDKSGNIIFERAYAILDGHSGLSTGCIGLSENEDLALAAYKLFAKRFRFLPREIRHDGASAHTSDRFEKFKEISSKLGVVWRPTKTSTGLSLVERYHSIFITRIGNGKDYFVGEGIKSKRDRARPSPERIALYRDADNLITQEELHKLYYSNEKEFNNDVITGKMKNKLSAQMKWNRSTPDNAVKIGPVEFIILFGEKKEITVQKGIVAFTHVMEYPEGVKSQGYSYSIYTKELLYKVNFRKVIVRYDPLDMSKAYLFSIEDDEFISTIEPTPSGEKATFAQTQVGKRNLKSHCDQKEALMDGIEADLDHYKRVYDRFQESKIPVEVLSAHDDKDLVDAANLDDFMRITEDVNRATEVKRSRKKRKTTDRPSEAKNLPASLRADSRQNAKNYQ